MEGARGKGWREGRWREGWRERARETREEAREGRWREELGERWRETREGGRDRGMHGGSEGSREGAR